MNKTNTVTSKKENLKELKTITDRLEQGHEYYGDSDLVWRVGELLAMLNPHFTADLFEIFKVSRMMNQPGLIACLKLIIELGGE